MKKLLFTTFLSLYSLMVYTAQPVTLGAKAPTTTSVSGKVPITAFKPVLPDVYIHNVGNQTCTLNSISFLFSINGKASPEVISYNIKINPNTTKKITDAKIVFNLPETASVSNSGISKIYINNNPITISHATNADTVSNGTSVHIYITNAQGAWKETTQPSVLTAKAKATSPQTASTAKSVLTAPKTSTLKSAATFVKTKANTMIQKSNTAKTIKTATAMPKTTKIVSQVAK